MYVGAIYGIPKVEVEENYEEKNTSKCITRKMTKAERIKYFGKEEKQ